ncbi:MAG: PCMD domain-containing protein [Bacteroidaceae bacterium]|nr:PCMD domain-containing protein [Bacteroidaceae bacterium]
MRQNSGIFRMAAFVLLLGVLYSCLSNDIPYPIVKLQILAFEAEGQVGNATINNEDRTVTFELSDTVDLKSVKIKKIELTDKALSSIDFSQPVDFSYNRTVTLSLYQDYVWTLKPQQNIIRKFVVENQVGESIIDDKNHRVVAYVSKDTDLRNITVKELVLGPTGSVVSPSISMLQDFTLHKTAIVTYRDIMEEWELYVFNTESDVSTGKADAWVNVAWLNGTGKDGSDNGFEYRRADSEIWTKVDPDIVKHNGGSFSARLTGLAAETEYWFRAYSDDVYGQEVAFTTQKAVPLENGNLDNWYKDGKVWNPWAESGMPFWDSGNKGSATLGESNTLPTDETWNGKGMAGRLESKFVGIAGIGKFAAGNLFVGDFIRVDGTNGVLNFGKPYSSYPTKLRCHYKYTTALIDNTSSEYAYLKGQPDTCSVYIALGDWDKPVEIRTRPSNQKLFDKNDPHIIAYAEFYSGESTSDYRELELTLDYRATDRKPTYIIVVASASKYGDFFTGGTGATMLVDDFELEFDY